MYGRLNDKTFDDLHRSTAANRFWAEFLWKSRVMAVESQYIGGRNPYIGGWNPYIGECENI